jgi:hypothetical protein
VRCGARVSSSRHATRTAQRGSIDPASSDDDVVRTRKSEFCVGVYSIGYCCLLVGVSYVR